MARPHVVSACGNKRWDVGVSLSLFLIFALLPLAAAQVTAGNSSSALAPSALEGRWVGEYQLGSQTTFLYLIFGTDNGRWGGTYNRPTIDWEESRALRSLAAGNERLEFQIGGDSVSPFTDSNPALTLSLAPVNGALAGTVESSAGKGKVRLVHLATLDKDYLEILAGDYKTPDGSRIVIERENRYLCFLDSRTGRTGRLMPQSETEFWSGPSLDLWYPAEWQFKFRRDRNGAVASLEVIRPGGRRLVAKKVSLYLREEVTFQNGDVRLAGTLRLPLTSKPAPAVVILHGSNYQTRGGQYGSLGFVGDQFARRGFAVLNYDKRGTGKSGGERDDNAELLAGDAAAGIQLLRTRKGVDPARVGVWGISQGGMLQPAVAAKVPDLAFFINVSGAAQNGNDQEIQRTELKLRGDGFPEAEIAAAVRFQQLKFRYACKRDNWDEYVAALEAARGKKWFPDPYVGPPDTKDSTAWDFWGCGGEGAKGFERIHAPMLHIYGEHEAYSRADLNVAFLQHSLAAAHNRDLTIREFKGAEHSMLQARNGGEKELTYLNTYAPGYFELLTAWASVACKKSRHPSTR